MEVTVAGLAPRCPVEAAFRSLTLLMFMLHHGREDLSALPRCCDLIT